VKIKGITAGELYGPAMKIETQEEADQYFELLVAYMIGCLQVNKETSTEDIRQKAEEITLQNLGYFAGYYDSNTIKRVKDLFGAKHPIFD
jgi:hypothetical protein